MDSRKVLSRLQERKFFLLLSALLLLMVLDPLLVGLHPGRKLFDLLFCVVLLATVFAVSQHKRPFLAALVLAVPALSVTWIVYVYYSFITLTTLGYGDVSPLAAPVRTFAWLEAVVGQLYIAVLVARLVGLHIAQSRRP